jgi:hypothetical protein
MGLIIITLYFGPQKALLQPLYTIGLCFHFSIADLSLKEIEEMARVNKQYLLKIARQEVCVSIKLM